MCITSESPHSKSFTLTMYGIVGSSRLVNDLSGRAGRRNHSAVTLWPHRPPHRPPPPTLLPTPPPVATCEQTQGLASPMRGCS